VLHQPSPERRRLLVDVARFSQAVVVMSRRAEEMLADIYGIPKEKIYFIPHGVPDVPFMDPNYYKDKFNVEGRLVLLTFGLLNPNKGIENVLEVLPDVVSRHPQITYIILGATHPEIKRVSGEEYRIKLQRMVLKKGLEQHVIFYDRFIDQNEVCEFIEACDIYITPYLSREQIVSGTLAYAVGMGKGVISTPYWYAEEILADGRGLLVEFGNLQQLKEAILELIENEPLRYQLRKRAYEFGRQMIWKEVGRQYIRLFEEVLKNYYTMAETEKRRPEYITKLTLPEMRLDYLERMTDDTGLLQRAIYNIPDRLHGYSTDDMARALVVVLMYYQQVNEPAALRLANIYLSFLHHAQLPNGQFYNFMDYTRKFVDGQEGEDTLGRVLWGLGYGVWAGPDESFRALCRRLVEQAIPNLDEIKTPRPMAYTICGLYAFLKRYGGATIIRRALQSLADSLVQMYRQHRQPDWHWFEEAITYGSARIPQALLLAGNLLEDRTYTQVGLESLDFLTRVLYNQEYFDLVGNQGWYVRGGEKAAFCQQPIDAG